MNRTTDALIAVDPRAGAAVTPSLDGGERP